MSDEIEFDSKADRVQVERPVHPVDDTLGEAAYIIQGALMMACYYETFPIFLDPETPVVYEGQRICTDAKGVQVITGVDSNEFADGVDPRSFTVVCRSGERIRVTVEPDRPVHVCTCKMAALQGLPYDPACPVHFPVTL